MKINIPLGEAEANSNMYGAVDQTAGRGAQQLLPSDEELAEIEKHRKAEDEELAKKKVKEKKGDDGEGDKDDDNDGGDLNDDEEEDGGDDSEEEDEDDGSDEGADSGDESDEDEEEEDESEASASAEHRSDRNVGKRRIRRVATAANGRGPLIISGFPGIGKSALFNRGGLVVSDSDSSTFPKDEFPNNYIAHIREVAPNNDVTLVSSHFEVRDELEEQGFDFVLVYPTQDQKDDYMMRYLQRGSPKAFLDLMYSNWDKFLESCQQQQGCIHVVLQPGQYLSDVIDDLL